LDPGTNNQDKAQQTTQHSNISGAAPYGNERTKKRAVYMQILFPLSSPFFLSLFLSLFLSFFLSFCIQLKPMCTCPMHLVTVK
jgi:hypothetical protein